MKRFVRIAALAVAFLVMGTVMLFSQGRKDQAQDPVCLLWVDKVAELSVSYKSETYYFCSKKDKDLFKENPSKYVKK